MAAFAAVIGSSPLFSILLYQALKRVMYAYQEATGTLPTVRTHAPWLRSMRGERPDYGRAASDQRRRADRRGHRDPRRRRLRGLVLLLLGLADRRQRWAARSRLRGLLAGPRSSAGKSGCLLSSGSEVRVLPGALPCFSCTAAACWRPGAQHTPPPWGPASGTTASPRRRCLTAGSDEKRKSGAATGLHGKPQSGPARPSASHRRVIPSKPLGNFVAPLTVTSSSRTCAPRPRPGLQRSRSKSARCPAISSSAAVVLRE